MPSWRLREFIFARLYVETSCLVWFGTMSNSNSALCVQPYSLWNDTITGYNGACAKVNVVFTARRHAFARSLLSAGVRRQSVSPPRSCTVLYPDGWRYHQTSFSARSPIILVFDPQALIPNSRRTPSSGVQNTQGRLWFWTEIAVYLGNGRR